MSLLVSLKDTEGRTGVKGTKGATVLFLHVLTLSRLPSQGSLIPSSHHILLGEGSERFTEGLFQDRGAPPANTQLFISSYLLKGIPGQNGLAT